MTAVLLFFLCANLLLLAALAVALPKGRRLLPMIGLGLFLPGLSLMLYAHLGQIWLPDHPLQARQEQAQQRGGQDDKGQDKERDVDASARAAQDTFAALSPEERMERIRAMVASLSERLYGKGGTPQEWLRLARAESTLGAKDKARDALMQAEEGHLGLKRQKIWLAASVAVLLASPLDDKDKQRLRQQMKEAKALFGSSDLDIKTLEEKLLPLLQ